MGAGVQGSPYQPSTSRASHNPFRTKSFSGSRGNLANSWASLFGTDKDGGDAFPASVLESAVEMETCNAESKLGAQTTMSESPLDTSGMSVVKQQQSQPSPVASPGLYSLTPPPQSDCLYVSHTSPPACSQQSMQQMVMPLPQLPKSPPQIGRASCRERVYVLA